MSKELSHEWWFTYTTHLRNALSVADQIFAEAPVPKTAAVVAARERAQRGYERDLMAAWNRYRPNGPLEGETLPGEVERIMRKQYSEAFA